LTAFPAFAWGCKGHQTVALIAERHLAPEARQYLESLLRANPIDSELKRYCGNFNGSLFADSSTWPDEVRNTRNNGPWHYIDIPRGASRGPIESYCGDRGCILRAITDQLAILKDARAVSGKRAEAVRYLIHFIGDLHMPLHAATNNDEGGNCVPVQYFRRVPQKQSHSYSPNLHSLWDTTIVERDMEGADPREYADFLEKSFAHDFAGWQNAGIHVDDWAWESHDLAQSVVYGKLRPKDPVEKFVPVDACTDDNNVGERMLQTHFAVGAKYQDAAALVIEKRLAQAGVRLAMVLNEAVKTAQSAN
jgi:hypothetical protein